MSQIKLYKKFYQINIIRTGSTDSTTEQVYTLFNPFSLSANTYTAGTGDTESSTIIESNLEISQDNIGIYFSNLNPYLYTSDITYDLVWFVNYTNLAPLKKISTRFRINTNTLTNQIEIEFINGPIEIEVNDSTTEIEIS
jgi:hypothetical protein